MNAARWLVALTSKREGGTSLALFRIAVGAVVLYSLGSVLAADLVGTLWIDARYGGMRAIDDGSWLLDLCGGAAPGVVWPLVVVALVSAAAVTLGIGGRVAPFVTLHAYRAVSTSGGVSGGYDGMIFNALWLLVLASATSTLSLDCRLRHGAWRSDEQVPAWPRYLAILQLVVIYAFTGVQKASASWTFLDGYSALYLFLQDPTWVRFDMAWTGAAYPLTQVATAVVWHFETGAPLLLLWYHCAATAARGGWLRRWLLRFDLRKPFAAIGIGMHLGIAVLLDMGPFSWISLAYYACLWGDRAGPQAPRTPEQP